MKVGFNKKNGFTVIELLLSISIAGIALIALSGATPILMQQINYARQRSTAAYLAQEGIELIKNIRDYNTMSSIAWDSTIDGSVPDSRIDYTWIPGPPLTSYNATETLKLNASGFYSYTGTTDTGFKRKISISKISIFSILPDYLEVVSTVYWTSKFGNHEIKVQDNLYPYFAPTP